MSDESSEQMRRDNPFVANGLLDGIRKVARLFFFVALVSVVAWINAVKEVWDDAKRR